jgi:multisubunit Na+/H+ antiporter MnhF subunit
MTLVMGAALIALLVGLVPLMIRTAGATMFADRVLAASLAASKVVLMVALASHLLGQPRLVDLALAFALTNWAVSVAVMKLSTYATLQTDLSTRTPHADGP